MLSWQVDKAVRLLYSVCMGIGWQIIFSESELRDCAFTKFERYSLARRHSVNFSHYFFHICTFVCKFGWLDRHLDTDVGIKLQTYVWKIRKTYWASSIAKLHPSNLMNTIFYLIVVILMFWCTNICVKFNIFRKSYLPSDSHTNTVISDLPVKMASKTLIR